MRIALNHTRFQVQGGVERYLWAMAHILVDRGHEVHLFCSRFAEPAPKGIIYHRVPMTRLGQTWKAFSFAFNSRKLLLREDFDIIQGFGKTIHGDVYRDGSGCISCYWRYLNKYEPWLLGTLGCMTSPKQRIHAYLERLRFRPGSYRFIVAISEAVKQQILSKYDVEEDRIQVIYPGVDVNRFRTNMNHRNEIRRTLGMPQDCSTGITLASNFTRKGITPLIKALASQKGRDWRFLILGKDRHMRQYKEHAEELGVSSRISFLGWQSDIEKYLAASDFFVLNSRFDAFGNSTMEAMASGLPCAVSARAGSSELIRDSVNGFVISDPDDVDELSSVMERFIADASLRRRMGGEARGTVERHTIKHNLDDYESIYQRLKEKKQVSRTGS